MGRRYFINYDVTSGGLVYFEKKPGWFSSGMIKKLDAFYFYWEDGKFYEFFTGKYLATHTPKYALSDSERESGPWATDGFHVEQSTLWIRIGWKNIYSYNYGALYLSEATAARFAEDVRKYMEDKTLICQAIHKFLDEKHQEWILQEKKKKCAEIEKRLRDDRNEAWLNDILDSRK